MKKGRPVELVLVGMMGILAGCGGEREAVTLPPEVAVPDVFVKELPMGSAVPIPEARTLLQPGDEVLLTGLVMGVRKPFVEERGMFVLGDEGTLTHCNAMDDAGHCPTPWDTCCDTPDDRAKGTASIQVLNTEGHVLARGLKGVGGLRELSRVTVLGRVSDTSTAEAFIVNASRIHVVPE
jgi:hypothetical protein